LLRARQQTSEGFLSLQTKLQPSLLVVIDVQLG